MPNRTHLEHDRILADLCQFATGIESFSQFLADKEAVAHGPGRSRICTLKEAVLLMTDRFPPGEWGDIYRPDFRVGTNEPHK